jgi:hypothetical protein
MSLKSLLSRRSSPEDRTPERDEWVGEYEVAQADLSKDADNDDEARSQMMRIEKDGPPKNLADWPTGKAMSLTFGGAEGASGYDAGEAHQLGPSSLRHYPDGSVKIRGEAVDNPRQYSRESVTDEVAKAGSGENGKVEKEEP